MLRPMWVMFALTACGRVDFHEYVDGGADSGDAPGGPCQQWSPFSTPTQIPGALQSPADDWVPTPSADERTLYFHSYRFGSMNAALYRATRSDKTAPFDAATLITELETSQFETIPTVTADELSLVFTRLDPPNSVLGDLFEARRTTPTGTFTMIGVIAEVSLVNVAEESPWISSDGLRLLFIRKGSFGEIYETTRPARDQPFVTPRMLAELDVATAADDTPTLSDDGLEIFFTSNRAGGAGGTEIWTARRPTVDDPFGAVTRVSELSSPLDDYGVRLSRDGSTIYLNHNAVISGGQDAQMYTATRTCLSP